MTHGLGYIIYDDSLIICPICSESLEATAHELPDHTVSPLQCALRVKTLTD